VTEPKNPAPSHRAPARRPGRRPARGPAGSGTPAPGPAAPAKTAPDAADPSRFAPEANRAAQSSASEPAPVRSLPAESLPAESRSAESRSAESRSAESRSARSRSAQSATAGSGRRTTRQRGRGQADAEADAGSATSRQPADGRPGDGQAAASKSVAARARSRVSAARQSIAGQTPAGQDTAGQTPAGQTPAGQGAAGQGTAGQGTAGQGTAGQRTAGQNADGRSAASRLRGKRSAAARPAAGPAVAQASADVASSGPPDPTQAGESWAGSASGGQAAASRTDGQVPASPAGGMLSPASRPVGQTPLSPDGVGQSGARPAGSGWGVAEPGAWDQADLAADGLAVPAAGPGSVSWGPTGRATIADDLLYRERLNQVGGYARGGLSGDLTATPASPPAPGSAGPGASTELPPHPSADPPGTRADGRSQSGPGQPAQRPGDQAASYDPMNEDTATMTAIPAGTADQSAMRPDAPWPGTLAGQTSAGQPPAGPPFAGPPFGGQYPVGQPSAGQPFAGLPSAGQPFAGQPFAGQPFAGQPFAGLPSAGLPSAGLPSAGLPSAGLPSAGQPSAGQPSAGEPFGGQPSGGAPFGGQFPDGQLSGGQPFAGEPFGGQPSGGLPFGGQFPDGQLSGGQPFAGQPTAGQPFADQLSAGQSYAGPRPAGAFTDEPTVIQPAVGDEPAAARRATWVPPEQPGGPVPYGPPAGIPRGPVQPARPSSSGAPGQAPQPGRTAGADAAGAPAAGYPGASGRGGELSARLSALARLIQIGSRRSGGDGISPKLIDDASDLLARAGERLRLSSSHTVVALAGGTGSGKSSLFNRIAGADFSTVGVTRPVTRDVHACVWGVSGSGPLLEWLGVPRRYRYARASALDGGEQSMAGLVLLDLPDHDSVMAHATDQVDQLVELADLMIWVLDPQKYADAAVHRRFLVPMAGHAEVLAVVLNQSDVLAPDQVEDCVNDLRRLLDAEELHDVQILVTSASTGAGVGSLLNLLADTVSARRAASARIAADVDAIVRRFEPYGSGDAGAPAASAAATTTAAAPPASPGRGSGRSSGKAVDAASAARLLAASPARLAAAFARAAGVAAIGDALQSARELRAVDYVGWPVTWIVERLVRRDPVRKIRLGKLWAELRGVTAGPSGAQQSEIDNALTELADDVGPGLPKPWSNTIRTAIRSRADDIPAALGDRIGAALPAENDIARWWRVVGVWQGLLLGGSIVGLAWIAAIIVFGVFDAATVPHLFSSLAVLPVIVLLIAAALVLGWFTASTCLKAVRAAAILEKEQVAEDMENRMTSVAQELVVAPAQQELAELERFRAELRIAGGQPG
jgi:hypothetical protein